MFSLLFVIDFADRYSNQPNLSFFKFSITYLKNLCFSVFLMFYFLAFFSVLKMLIMLDSVEL